MSLVILFILFAAVIGSAAMVGVIGYLMNRIRQLELQASGELQPRRVIGSEGLRDELRDELMAMQDEIERLTERVDFTERLLSAPEEDPSTSSPGREGGSA